MQALTEEQEARLAATRIRQQMGMLAEVRMKQAARKDRPGFEELARWFIGRVPSGREVESRDSMKAAKIEAWLPVECRRTPPKRGQGVKLVEKAFWPGYVFVRLVPGAEAWAGAILAGELVGWISQGVVPTAIPTDEIAVLQRCEKSGDFEREAKLIGIPMPGDTVEISAGWLAGSHGVVKRFNDAKQQVSLLVDMLGGKVSATISLDDIIVSR
ncbi:transcription termination/antitermination protein NusG [Zhengella mangrovi]|nr:transcription termination/antitermination NusG family protein [Zhengella mangrovi]